MTGRRSPSSALLWLGVLAVLGALVYAPGLDIPYYSDDFQYVLAQPHRPPLERFHERNDETGFYRPLEAILLGAIQGRVGTDPRPVHLAVLATHVLLAWMVWLGLVRLGVPPPAGEIASAAFLVWQTNAMAVLSNDTFSQVLATALGCASALLLWSALDAPAGERRGARAVLGALGIAAFAGALFTKESGIGFLPILLFLLAVQPAGARRTTGRVLVGLALAATVGLYFHLRATAAGAELPTAGAGRYQFRFGENVPLNAGRFALAIVMPTSTVGLFDALHARRWLAVAAMGVAAAAAVAFVAAGVREWRRPRLALALVAMAAFAVSPLLLLNHVSELYAYAATPFVAALAGAGFAGLLARTSGMRRTLVMAGIGALLFGHVLAVRQKGALMEANGRRAERLGARLEPYLRGLPRGATLWLVNRAPHPPSYSVFRIHDFDVLRDGESYLGRRYGRPDVAIRVVDAPGPPREARRPGDLALQLESTGDRP